MFTDSREGCCLAAALEQIGALGASYSDGGQLSRFFISTKNSNVVQTSSCSFKAGSWFSVNGNHAHVG